MCTVSLDARSLRAVAVFFVLAVAVATLVWPSQAQGAELTWPLEHAAESLLSFGGSYASSKGDSTHLGIDLAAGPQDRVLSPGAGTVTFVGSVPSVGGGTVTALTLATDGGLSVTLLPLSSVVARRGDPVSAGDELGAVAASGDRSFSSAHLHVGVRRQEVYLDPATVLTPPQAVTATPPASAEPAPAPKSTEPVPSGTAPGSARAADAPAATGEVADSPAIKEPRSMGSQQPVAAQSRQTPEISSAAEQASAMTVAASEAGLSAAGSPGPGRAADGRAARNAGRDGRTARAAPSSAVAQAASVAGRIARSLNTVWRAALLGTLIGLAALWPIMRRREHEEQPEVSTAPGGSDVAAVVGRW